MDILDRVIDIVKAVMETDEVTADTLMEDDLEIASLEFYDLLSKLEKEFEIKIPEKILSNVETVDDIAYEVETIMRKKGLM